MWYSAHLKCDALNDGTIANKTLPCRSLQHGSWLFFDKGMCEYRHPWKKYPQRADGVHLG